MKKEVKGSSIKVLSCSESSSDESEKELPNENTEELKKYLQTDEDDQSIKKTSSKKSKRLIKKRKTSYDNSDDQDEPPKSIKKTKKFPKNILPRKVF